MDSENNPAVDEINEAGGDPPRRSERPNIGQMPDRYGQPVYYNVRESETPIRGVNEELVVTSELRQRRGTTTNVAEVREIDRRSVRSVCSVRSTRSVQKRIEAELKLAEEVAAQKKERIARERARLERQAEFDRKADEEEFAARIAVVNLRTELEKSKIEEEDNLSQHLSEDENSQDDDLISEASIPYRRYTPELPPQQSNQLVIEKLGEVMTTMATAIDKIASSSVEKKQDKESSKSVSSKFLARQATSKDLPHFHGDPEEWPTFIGEYERSTKFCEYTNVENISRLQKCLKGKARDAVKSLLTVPENVDRVIKILKVNFGRPDFIVESILEKVKKMQAVKEGRFDLLLEYSNAVMNAVSTMKGLNSIGHLGNPQLAKELVMKLPTYLQHQWCQARSEKPESDLECFAEWLFDAANNATYVCSYKQTSDRDQDRKGKTSRVFTTTEQEKPHLGYSADKRPCPCCKRIGHNLANCSQFPKMNHEDRWIFVRKVRVCFQCLKPGHRSPDCKASTCGQDGCTKEHHMLLHRKIIKTPAKPPEVKERSVMACRSSSMKKTLLEILPVVIVGPKTEVFTYALLDPGAEDSFIESSVATQVGLVGPRKPIRLLGPGISTPCYEAESREVTCGIKGTKDKKVFKMSNISTVKNLNLPRQSVDMVYLCEAWPHLQDVPISSFNDVKPTVLIGQDNCHLLSYDRKVSGTDGGPIAIKTPLGWVVHGKTTPGGATCEDTYVCHLRKEDDVLHQLVKESFQTETFGVKITKEPLRSKEDQRAQELMKKHSRQIISSDGLTSGMDQWMFEKELPDLSTYSTARWMTCLPWKEDNIQMPESYSMAFRRLKSIEKKMDRSQVFAAEYMDKIETYVTKGFARKLSREEASIVGPRTWYLPHFDVVNPNKPGKFRLVFDAAAKSNGVSLNDVLIQGPDLLNPLANILMQFREKKVGFTADIRDMFHRVWIQPEDSSSQRFIWKGLDRSKPPDVYEMQVMVFGAVSSPYCAHYIKNLNAERFSSEFPEAVDGIIKKHYVDDYLDCADSEEEAIKIIQDVRMIHRKGGFDIVGWTSSSKQVLKKIPLEYQATGQKDMEPDSLLPVARVLGLYWDPNDDVFTFTCKFNKVNEEIVNGGKRPTKREMLKLVMSVFDPLGFLAHFTVKAKILLQEVWRTDVDWDEEVTEEIFIKWCCWLEELKKIPKLKINRCYSLNIPTAKNIQLHVFCDASMLSFATVAYIRVEYEENMDVSFVMAKTRVAPLKCLSLPRLELQGAVMAVRLAKTLKEGLTFKIDSVHFWTDNSCVLGWIRSDSRRFVTFVANRIGEIQEDSKVSAWHWVPTAENVADDATRDKELCDFSPNSRWVNGPSFLKLPQEDWPKEKFQKVVDLEEMELMKINVVWKAVSAESLPDLSRFSSWLKVIRTTAWLVRFICRVKKAPTNTDDWESWRAPVIQCLGGSVLRRSSRNIVQVVKKIQELTSEEYIYAEKLWLRQCQWDSFPEEMLALSSEKPLKNSSKLLNLSPYLDNGIMKLRGRLQKGKLLQEETRSPVILDPKHPYSVLLIKHYHEEAHHIGQERVVNELRQKYWILNIRTAVKSSWNNCNVCKISRAKPTVPEMADLPEYRLDKVQRPFTYTGLDYFGPMEVTIGRRHEKRYGALFTCLSTRAIHLELANTLDTDSVIMALSRFIGRRGSPQKVFSDNGTNFHGADNELKKCLKEINSESIRARFGHQGMDWIFNPPSAPHMGGVWERLVRSVKTALNIMLKTKFPKEEVLHTALIECERIINSRPITHCSMDPEDEEALTPNHFLIGSSNGAPPPGDFHNDVCPTKRWKHFQVLADHFWKRWMKEYLPSLSRRSKWIKKAEPIKIGDLVFIADGDLPRCQWPRGRIIKVYPGKDGQVRVADVKTSSGIYKRPVVKLCPLDVDNFVVNASPDTSTAGSMLSSSVK